MTTIKENVSFSSGSVDREAGVIRGVKILGKSSKNGRVYSDRAMEQACTAYAGIGVCIDHEYDRNNRSFRDSFGWLENTTIKESGVWGDLHFLKAHPMADSVCEAAERNPSQLGLSHDADGVVSPAGNGGVVVEEIQKINSVDLVRSPATNNGLFEERKDMSTDTLTKKTRLQEIADELAVAAPEAGAAPAAESSGATAFAKEIMSILGNPELDKASKLKRIRSILDAQEKLEAAMGPAEVPAAPVAPAEAPAAVPESLQKVMDDNKRILEQIESKEKKEQVRVKLQEKEVVPTEGLVDSLCLLEEKAQDSIIESLASKPAHGFGSLEKPSVAFRSASPNANSSSYDEVVADSGLSSILK